MKKLPSLDPGMNVVLNAVHAITLPFKDPSDIIAPWIPLAPRLELFKLYIPYYRRADHWMDSLVEAMELAPRVKEITILYHGFWDEVRTSIRSFKARIPPNILVFYEETSDFLSGVKRVAF